ncbi:MAG: cytochrome c3 family protein [Sandaracinus sp.]
MTGRDHARRADGRRRGRRADRAAALVALGLALAAGLGALSAVRAQRRDDPPLADRSAGRSVVVYPMQRIAIRMDHSLPEHRALACQRCHTRAQDSREASDTLVPDEASCGPCHDAERDRSQPTTEHCGTCHLGYEAEMEADGGAPRPSAIVPSSSMPAPHLRFSHAAHVSRDQSCESCHVGISSAREGTRAHLPTMRDCFRCHAPAGLELAGAESPAAPLVCGGCHPTDASGMLRTHFPEGDLSPPRWLAGMAHDHEWLVRHRWVAADEGPLCAQCHRESECAACHDGRVRPLRVHPGDFLSTHPVMARRDETHCTSCHTLTQFCAECHARLGIAPIAAPEARAAQRYHPPPGVWSRGPQMHAIEARRSLQSCVSCHAEDDCVACHGSTSIGGGGASPHPPGFASQCRSALDTNAHACATCHGDLEALRARCP